MKEDIHILIVEDDPTDAELVEHNLRDGGLRFSVERVETKEEFENAIALRPPDLIFSDYTLPGFDGFQALSIAREKCPEVPFLFVTGTLGEEVVIETLKQGATDYVLKTRLSRLVPAVHRALREAHERHERREAVEKLRESHKQLRALSVYLQSVREEERTHIAREVHDELGQTLTGLKLSLVRLTHQLPPHMREHLETLRNLTASVDATIQTVRRITTELRPGILDTLGLVAAIVWQAHDFQQRTGIACNVSAPPEDQDLHLSRDLDTTFFRIFQETLTNIIRHAGATSVDVSLGEREGALELVVRDNGRGIADEEVTRPGSLGLLGMRERAALLGGEFSVQGEEGQGTRVMVRIPLPQSAEPMKAKHESSHRGRPRRREARSETNPRR